MISTEQIQAIVLERLKTVIQQAVDEALEEKMDEIKALLAEEKKSDAE